MSDRFELNTTTVGEILKGMGSICASYAQGIAKNAGDGYVVTTYIGKTRANASVYPATEKAYRDNLKNNTLLKAVGK